MISVFWRSSSGCIVGATALDAKEADVLLAKMTRHAGQYLLVLLLDQLLAVHADRLVRELRFQVDRFGQPVSLNFRKLLKTKATR